MEEYITRKCIEKNVYPTLYVSNLALRWLEERLYEMGFEIEDMNDTFIEDGKGETMEVVILTLKSRNYRSVSQVLTQISDFLAYRRIFLVDEPMTLNHNVMMWQDNIMTLKRMRTTHYWLMDNSKPQFTATLNIGFAYPWHQSWCDTNIPIFVDLEHVHSLHLFELIAIKIALRGARVNRKLYSYIRDLIKERINVSAVTFNICRWISEHRWKMDYELILYLAFQIGNGVNNTNLIIEYQTPSPLYLPALLFYELFCNCLRESRIRFQWVNTDRGVFRDWYESYRNHELFQYRNIFFQYKNIFVHRFRYCIAKIACYLINGVLRSPNHSTNVTMKQYTDTQKLKYLTKTPKLNAYVEIDWEPNKPSVNITLANFTVENWNFLRQYSPRQIKLNNCKFTLDILVELTKFDFTVLQFNNCTDLNDTSLVKFIESCEATQIRDIMISGSTEVTKLVHYLRAEKEIGLYGSGCMWQQSEFSRTRIRPPRLHIEGLEQMTTAEYYIFEDKLVCDADLEL